MSSAAVAIKRQHGDQVLTRFARLLSQHRGVTATAHAARDLRYGSLTYHVSEASGHLSEFLAARVMRMAIRGLASVDLAFHLTRCSRAARGCYAARISANSGG